MQITRTYYNSSGEALREDVVSIELLPPVYKELNASTDPGLQMRVGGQIVRTTLLEMSEVDSDRVVDSIIVSGEYDVLEASLYPPYDMTWATKTLANDQIIRFDMSNLPKTTDLV